MWAKALYFRDFECAEKILAEKDSPMACKNLGRQVKNYDDVAWEKVRYEMMLKPNIERFLQDQDLQNKIIDSKFDGLMFVEASPWDRIWGIGLKQSDPGCEDASKWKGRNLLGKVITESRAEVLNRLNECYHQVEECKNIDGSDLA